jgi:hypothetical protein
LNDPLSSQRLALSQSQSGQPQLAPQSHTEPQVHVGTQEQAEPQSQPLVFMLVVFASFVVVFIRHLVFGLPASYGRRARAS